MSDDALELIELKVGCAYVVLDVLYGDRSGKPLAGRTVLLIESTTLSVKARLDMPLDHCVFLVDDGTTWEANVGRLTYRFRPVCYNNNNGGDTQ